MIVFVTSAISLLLLAVSCYLLFKGSSLPDEPKDRMPSVLLAAVAVTLCAGCIAGGGSVEVLMLEIQPALVAMLVLESSFWENRRIRPLMYAVAVSYVVPLCLHIAVAAGWTISPSESLLRWMSLLLVFIPPGFFFVGISRRLRDVRMILKTGTIWANVSLAVDAVYVLIYVILSLSCIAGLMIFPDRMLNLLLLFPFLTGLMLAALGIRHADDILFLFWRVQERRILESMKVTKVETAVDPSGIEDIYQDIYERVVAYFEAEKPFLDNELTINDLSKVLYSNKLYISRAISQFTGRNFCQFVNYYRVAHSMEMFRNNHDLKIHELAGGSGFNSDVSYNMAFRLFMGETPGEWCRKERNRKIKMKK